MSARPHIRLSWVDAERSADAEASSFAAVDGKLALELPVYFAGCARDHVCIAAPSAEIVRQFCSKGTVETFDTGHWVQLEIPDKLNRALQTWLEKSVGK